MSELSPLTAAEIDALERFFSESQSVRFQSEMHPEMFKRLIAYARTDLPRALEIIRQQAGEIARLREELKASQEFIGERVVEAFDRRELNHLRAWAGVAVEALEAAQETFAACMIHGELENDVCLQQRVNHVGLAIKPALASAPKAE